MRSMRRPTSRRTASIYHARDMAVVRARLRICAVVLASATPSMETRENARQGRYGRLQLDSRFAGRALPTIEAIDLRQRRRAARQMDLAAARRGHAENFARSEQALLFLNRRGYAPLTLCHACGHRFQCPNCSAWLVEHRSRRALVCHHCGHVERRPENCPAATGTDTLIACGPGVERVAEEAADFSRRPAARAVLRHAGRDASGCARNCRRWRSRIRSGHRHANGRQGPSFSASDFGRRGRRRSRAGQWRSARRRAHLPVAQSGGGPRRARRKAGPRPAADLSAGASGDAGAAVRRSRALLPRRDRRCGATPACRPSAGSPRDRRPAPDRATTETHARALARAACLPPENRAGALRAGRCRRNRLVLGPAEAPIAMVRGKHPFPFAGHRRRAAADLQGFPARHECSAKAAWGRDGVDQQCS